ncbi:hypothetical protein CEUSTIGMA_g5930.t1 [Chlamydomonas eustigma]|uniref:SS18 N-terminal domain-containing protein n=1 Tax=Chlamydomonas eustigma TaxID=1157962 RepID=A0A250X5Y6_9CHLO|nr:hypothetical protein CEUSTIGMA_g5930.t1 [Chlamydomonas eustigma]|eukprot:GAX78491.1 hypothetical protein CEUSTIGMA_g5930.t1 [Chlamydomonas eustigma]
MAQPQLTTDEIQRMLEENYGYIKAILDQQNLGRLPQMQEYQNKLQQNLMLLAAVADAQPPATTAPATAQQPATAPRPQPGNQAASSATLYLGGAAPLPTAVQPTW